MSSWFLLDSYMYVTVVCHLKLNQGNKILSFPLCSTQAVVLQLCVEDTYLNLAEPSICIGNAAYIACENHIHSGSKLHPGSRFSTLLTLSQLLTKTNWSIQ